MTCNKNHFVLVHGAFHGAWCWYKVTTILRAAGHRVTVPDLAACGVNPKQAREVKTLSDYSQPLLEIMASLPTREKVILVGHSYGGLSMALAMECFTEKISAAVFVTAIMPNPSFPMIYFANEFLKWNPSESKLDTGISFNMGHENHPTSLRSGPDFLLSKMYQVCSPEVTVPVRPLLSLVGRILLVDGSLCQALLPFTIVTEQEFICSELPTLHLYSLDLLTAIIKGVHSQILPQAANIVRLLTEYFRRCALPAARIRVYSIMRTLLISMGVGMALYLAQEVINNAFADLNFNINECDSSPFKPSSSKHGTGVSQPPAHKKRKPVSASEMDSRNGVDHEPEICKLVVPISVQIAALQALEALITVGGALKSECWRANVDLLLITVAINGCDGSWSHEERNIHLLAEPSSSFQLAALQALLASLLSPSRVRPPYLSQGLALFREGKRESGTKIAQFCAHALLTLEVLYLLVLCFSMHSSR